jgi:hypothetical protein
VYIPANLDGSNVEEVYLQPSCSGPDTSFFSSNPVEYVQRLSLCSDQLRSR